MLIKKLTDYKSEIYMLTFQQKPVNITNMSKKPSPLSPTLSPCIHGKKAAKKASNQTQTTPLILLFFNKQNACQGLIFLDFLRIRCALKHGFSTAKKHLHLRLINIANRSRKPEICHFLRIPPLPHHRIRTPIKERDKNGGGGER